jgi:hypothetical protein
MESEFEHLFQDLNKAVKDLEHEIAFRDWDMVLEQCGEIQVKLNEIEIIAKKRLRQKK